jgi:hypothetical protein
MTDPRAKKLYNDLVDLMHYHDRAADAADDLAGVARHGGATVAYLRASNMVAEAWELQVVNPAKVGRGHERALTTAVRTALQLFPLEPGPTTAQE